MSVSTYKDDLFLKKYEKYLTARQKICFRAIDTLIKPLSIKYKTVVDIGCGPGNLASTLSKRGAYVTGTDKSASWISFCKKKYTENKHLKFVTADGGKMPFIKSHSVDVVIMNLVLPNVDSLKGVTQIFKEVGRILKKDGVFIFSDIHPILKMSSKVHPDRYQKYKQNFSYFLDNSGYTSGITFGKKVGESIEFNNKHWTLETYTKLLSKAGLYVYSLSEPTYKKGDPQLLLEYKIPEYLMFACKKIK